MTKRRIHQKTKQTDMKQTRPFVAHFLSRTSRACILILTNANRLTSSVFNRIGRFIRQARGRTIPPCASVKTTRTGQKPLKKTRTVQKLFIKTCAAQRLFIKTNTAQKTARLTRPSFSLSTVGEHLTRAVLSFFILLGYALTIAVKGIRKGFKRLIHFLAILFCVAAALFYCSISNAHALNTAQKSQHAAPVKNLSAPPQSNHLATGISLHAVPLTHQTLTMGTNARAQDDTLDFPADTCTNQAINDFDTCNVYVITD